MTSPEPTSDPELPAELAIVAALLDGEDVDAEALRESLATPAGRDYLVDLLRLRRAVSDMGPARLISRPRSWSGAFQRAAVAALVLILAGVGGYVLGQRTGLVADVHGASSTVETVVAPSAPRAPRPTQVIRLQ